MPRGRPCLHMGWRQAGGLHDSLLAQNHRSLMDSSAIPLRRFQPAERSVRMGPLQDHACQGDGRANLGCNGNSPQRSHRRNRSVASRQRHQSPRPATNRRNPTRNAPGPVETTPRPGYRACHRPASRCKGGRATSSTHRSYPGRWHDDRQRPHQKPERPASGPSAPSR